MGGVLLQDPEENLVHGSHRDWQKGKAFPSQGILVRLEKSGNFTQNTGKIRNQLKILGK